MSFNLKPLVWHWESVVKGDTYPAAVISESSSGTSLLRIKIEIKSNGNTTSSLILDSDTTGITLTSTSPGSWGFTIDSISAEITDTLDEQYYAYQLKSYDSNGVVRTEFVGKWEVTPQIPV